VSHHSGGDASHMSDAARPSVCGVMHHIGTFGVLHYSGGDASHTKVCCITLQIRRLAFH
jgi:hypothetical protein